MTAEAKALTPRPRGGSPTQRSLRLGRIEQRGTPSRVALHVEDRPERGLVGHRVRCQGRDLFGFACQRFELPRSPDHIRDGLPVSPGLEPVADHRSDGLLAEFGLAFAFAVDDTHEKIEFFR
jgi:hypothetical protein